MAFAVPWKCRDCKFLGSSSPYSSLWLTWFRVAKMPKAQWDMDRKWIQSWRFLLHMDKYFSSTLRISTNQTNSVFVCFVDSLFHVLRTLANQCLSNYHISLISCNILSLGSFFSRHQPFDTLWFQLHYTLTT